MCLFCNARDRLSTQQDDHHPGSFPLKVNLGNPAEEKNLWVLYQSSSLIVCHKEGPSPVAGWLMIAPARHITDQRQLPKETWEQIAAAQFFFTDLIQKQTGAHRVYQAMFAEKTPHLHYHLIPSYKSGGEVAKPGEGPGPSIFSESTCVDDLDVQRFVLKLAQTMKTNLLPGDYGF